MSERISKLLFKFRKEFDGVVVTYVDGKKALLEPEQELIKLYNNKKSGVIRKMYQDIAKKGIGAFELDATKELDPKTNKSLEYHRYFVGISERHPAFNLSNFLHLYEVERLHGSKSWPNCKMIAKDIVKQLYKEIKL